MSKAMNEIGAERFALKILSVGVDVVVGNLVDVFIAFAAKIHAGFESDQGGVLRAKNDAVDFTLAGRKFAVRRNGTRDVGGVASVLRADIQDDDVAVFDFARQFVVVQRGGVGAGANDRGVALCFRAAPGVDLDHLCGYLIFVQAGAHPLHGFEVRVQGQANRFFEESDLAGRFYLPQAADLRPNVLQLGLRRSEFQPLDDRFFVGVTAKFFLIRKNGVEIRICLGKIFDGNAKVALERFYGRKSGARFDARVGWRHADAVPSFFLRILCREKKCFSRDARHFAFLPRGQDYQAGSFFVVARKVIEILFLLKNVVLRAFFAARKAPQND